MTGTRGILFANHNWNKNIAVGFVFVAVLKSP